MNRLLPVAQDAHSPRVDSSYSKTHLTSRNYGGPRLLRSIRGYSEAATEPAAPSASTESTMAIRQNEDFMAPPQSSDEDVEEQNHSGTSGGHSDSSGLKRKAGIDKALAPTKKRKTKIEAKPTRVSQRNMKPVPPMADSASAPTSDFTVMDFPDFLSQSSQPRKQQRAKFGKTNSYTLSSSQVTQLADPGEIPNTPRKSKAATFTAIDSSPECHIRTPPQKARGPEVPPSAEKVKEVAVRFNIPDEMGLPVSSSTSTELSTSLDLANTSEVASRRRASSTSSLSSVDSIASYELSQQQKQELGQDITAVGPLPAGHIRCPLCSRAVKVSGLASQVEPSSLSLRKQQIFCHSHRTRDAQIQWQAKKYPIIDWTLLEKKGTGKHVNHLRQVLYRKEPSYYLDNLEAKVGEFRGNKNKIRQYLANDIVETVKPGYYGPKGAKVMGHAIATDMSHHLKRGLKVDQTVRAVGVSGFVSAVLLPELLQKIVMEDMGISTEAEARTVIAESTETGMLLWPDDDHVVLDDDVSLDKGEGIDVVRKTI